MARPLLPALVATLAVGLCACRDGKPSPGPLPTVEVPVATSTGRAVAVPSQALLAGPATYAVIVGVLSFGERGVAGWSKDLRKDRELYEALRARGVPAENMVLILDDKALQTTVYSALAKLSKRAGPGSTLLFYYAGHGTRDEDGRPHFVAFDSQSADMAKTGIAVDRVATTVRDHFRGDRVVFMADACYSGALGEAVDVVAGSGKVQAASLTSADASNTSTNNWTFTQTVLDGLVGGDGLMDSDRNGTISLGELSAAVADAMKYREKQRHGFSTRGIDEGLVVARTATRSPALVKEMPAGRYVMAPRKERGGDEVAQVRAAEGGDRLVRFYDYNHAVDRKVPAEALTAISFERHPVGSDLRVFWGGHLYDAKVLRADGDFHFITYEGWGPEWNEWVMSDRIAGPEGAGADRAAAEVVEVEWEGTWWPALILKTDGDRYRIHYVGYGDEWDEWVTSARLRRGNAPAGKEGAAIEVKWRGTWWKATIRDQEGGRYLIRYVGYGPQWDEWVGEDRIRRTGASGTPGRR